jgi:nucleoside-diphosphate-sugar epimerase
MKVLVSGGTGELGHLIVQEFLDAGHSVTIYCRGQNKQFPPPANAELIAGDRQNIDDLKKKLRGLKFDVVIDTIPKNLETTSAFIDLFNNKISHYIHCSSVGVYTPLQYIPADERHPWQESTGINFMWKVAVDKMVLDAHAQNGFPATVIRPSSFIGPGRVPIDIWGARNIKFFKRIVQEREITVPNHGMSLIHSIDNRDLARSFLLAAQTDKSVGQVYNICGPHAVTLNKYLELWCEELKKQPPVAHKTIDSIVEQTQDPANRRRIEFLVHHMCFTTTKAMNEIDYSPRYTLQQSIADTHAWMLKEKMLSISEDILQPS